jgi:uncharacterized membrane protein YedE/YeeE
VAFIQVEVETLTQLREALDAGVTMVLLDNMDLPTLREAVAMAGGRCSLEISGGVTFEALPALAATGVIDSSKSFYTAPRFTFLGYIVGGLLFGFGMVLAGGCGSKTLVRLGAGSLKALVVFIVLGVTAFITASPN